MAVSRNKRNNNRKQKNNKDIFGLFLIIISAFFLLCLIIPGIFSLVSEGIRFVLLGTLGVFAYAAFGGLLAAGICICFGKKIHVSKSLLAFCTVALFLFLLILQIATTSNSITSGFGDYIKGLYGRDVYTAGGAIFGILAYGIANAMTVVIAYVVLILALLAVSFFIGRKIYFKYRPSLARMRERKETVVDSFGDEPELPHGAVFAEPGNYRSVSSLFCERIYTRDAGVAPQEQAEPAKVQNARYQQQQPQPVQNNKDIGRRMGSQEAMDWLYAQKNAPQQSHSDYDRRENDTYTRRVSSDTLYVSDTPRPAQRNAVKAEPIYPPPYDSYPADEYDVPKMPRKIVHENRNLRNIIIPMPKQVDEDVPGEIISSAKLTPPASQSRESGGYSQPSAPQSSFFTSPPEKQQQSGSFFGGFNNFSPSENFASEPARNDAPQFEEEDDDFPPIISNSILRANQPEPEIEEEDEYSHIKNDAAEYNDAPIINSKSYFDTQDDEEGKAAPVAPPPAAYSTIKPRPVDDNDSPIINSSFISAEDEYEEEYADEPEIDEYHEESRFSIASDSKPYFEIDEAPDKPEKTGGLVVDDEVIDRTERGMDFGNDDTGYYTTNEAPSERSTINVFDDINEKPITESTIRPKRPRIRQNEPIGGQISIDESLSISARPVPTPPISRRAEPYNYSPPPMDLLSDPMPIDESDTEDIDNKRLLIESTLSDLKYPAKVINVIKGPTVTRFELQPPQSMSVRKILGKDSDIEYALAVKGVRIEAPIAGKQAIGIEVPNTIRTTVYLKELLNSGEFLNNDSALPLALGKDLGGGKIIKSLEKMPHLLVAGATGTGKSVCLNALILSLVYHCSPDEMRMLLVDPKCVEFAAYRQLPHLLVPTPIIDPQHTINALDWAIEEMNNRYQLFSSKAVRNIGEYNKMSEVKSGKLSKLQYIVIIVDELADLMLSRKREVEDRIRNITQKSRAAGIHLILATQRPSVDVITGTIKINLPCRMAFSVTSNPDSRTVLDQGGAESLVGNGDMLFMPQDSPDLKRLQGALVTNDEISSIVNYVIRNNRADFDPEIENAIFKNNEPAPDPTAVVADEESGDDKLLPNIMRTLITAKSASTSMLQRRFALGYARASRIIDIIEQRGWIGKMDGSKPREVFLTVSQFEEIFQRPFNDEE